MLYKYLNEDGTPRNGGSGKWSLPTQNEDGTWTPGEWMPPIVGELAPCRNGYHILEQKNLLDWSGPACFEVEYRGERVNGDDKAVVREARLLRRLNWNEHTARLFACDCAERVVHLCGDDPRPRAAIETARRYANGEATDQELGAARATAWDAAWAAARDAARDAAWAAAWDAARAAAWDAARATAWAAAWAATRDAAWAAARDAARATEREWQIARLTWYLEQS